MFPFVDLKIPLVAYRDCSNGQIEHEFTHDVWEFRRPSVQICGKAKTERQEIHIGGLSGCDKFTFTDGFKVQKDIFRVQGLG